jgi:hypothetical protein
METVTLGVTGHRYLAETDKITAGIEEAVGRILTTFPDSNFRVFSSLAEGADRLLAERLLLLPQARLWVTLPLPEEEYLKDFKTRRSQQEFLHLLGRAERVIQVQAAGNREEGYLAAGIYVLENSDVLIAIWDGRPAQGRAGTAEIVALRRAGSLPLIWIHAGNRKPGTNTPTSLGAEQGEVTYENFPQDGRKA